MRPPVRGRRTTDDRLIVGGPRAANRRDPRWMVALVALSALLIGGAAVTVLLVSLHPTRSSVQLLANSLAQPKNALLAAERANVAAQASLAAAAGSTGAQRTALLTASIDHGQEASTEWDRYHSTAVGLPGEQKLSDRYVADQSASHDISSSTLVPILNSTLPGVLPQEQVAAHEAVRDDLIKLHSLYREADASAMADLGNQTDRTQQLLEFWSVVWGAAVVVGFVIGWRNALRVMAGRAKRHEADDLAAFETRLRRALELIDSDAAAFAVAERAVGEMLPAVRVSLLRADASRARLTPIGAAPVCGVATPNDCPALRSSSTVSFSDSDALDACPVLASNTAERCSATCVPLTVAGRGAAVLTLVGCAGNPPDSHGVTDLVARGVGDRVTLLQALATFQLQAERDPLTGLLNRRSLQAAVEPLISAGGSYAVVFGDLDHFKQLNDLHGHDAGDRALRAFSRTLRESLRPQDITCRWGGEEFVIVLPDCDATLAIEAMDRVRTNLALGSIAGQTTVVTASFGVAQSSDAELFAEVVELADTALRFAKETGRNRVVRYEPGLQPGAALPANAPG